VQNLRFSSGIPTLGCEVRYPSRLSCTPYRMYLDYGFGAPLTNGPRGIQALGPVAVFRLRIPSFKTKWLSNPLLEQRLLRQSPAPIDQGIRFPLANTMFVDTLSTQHDMATWPVVEIDAGKRQSIGFPVKSDLIFPKC